MSAFVTGSEYVALPRSPETWLVEGLLPVGGSMLLYGDPKVGKSYAALQLACCLSSGVEWLGFPIPQAVRAAYVQLDTPRSLWAARVEALADAGHPTELVRFADLETLETGPFSILDPNHFAKLRDDILEVKPDVVFVDTLRESCTGADENDSKDMQNVVSHLTAAVKPAALVLISHARKSNPEYGYDLMNDNRGSNYIVGRMDAIVRFSHASMRCTSRTMEEHSTKIERVDDGTWILSDDPMRGAAEKLLQDNPTMGTREMARVLADLTSKSESACRAYLRRLQAKRAA